MERVSSYLSLTLMIVSQQRMVQTAAKTIGKRVRARHWLEEDILNGNQQSSKAL